MLSSILFGRAAGGAAGSRRSRLLPNVLAKNVAVAARTDEAVFVRRRDCQRVFGERFALRSLGAKLLPIRSGQKVLPGITRLVLSELANELGIPLSKRPMREAEARGADEVVHLSTTRELSWVAVGWPKRWRRSLRPGDAAIARGFCGEGGEGDGGGGAGVSAFPWHGHQPVAAVRVGWYSSQISKRSDLRVGRAVTLRFAYFDGSTYRTSRRTATIG